MLFVAPVNASVPAPSLVRPPLPATVPPTVSVLPLTVSVRPALIVTGPEPRFKLVVPVKVKLAFQFCGQALSVTLAALVLSKIIGAEMVNVFVPSPLSFRFSAPPVIVVGPE